MLRDWDKRYPGRIETMFSAMQNVVPSHLSDVNLFDFKGIQHGSAVVDGGDLAFDREEIPMQPPAGSRKKMTRSWMSCA
jgi:tRNA 2-thiocytidine biosynthesis protein TtcA